MDVLHFDDLARAIVAASTRRTMLGLGAGGLLGALGLDDAEAKKKRRKKKCKKKCGPCAKCNKGKCKAKPAGTPCGEGQQCFADGRCVACDVCHSGCPFISLQAALDAASEGATIQVCPGRYATTADISKAIAAVIGAGSGQGGTILDGQGMGRVVQVGVTGSTPEIAIRALTITGGASDVGAGVYNTDSLTLEDVHLTDNRTTGSGGGLYSFIRTVLINTRVTGNSAGDGGGILSNGTLILTAKSVVTGNTGNTSGGNDGHTAGGITNQGGTVQIIDGSSVTGNIPFDCSGTDAC